MDYKIQLKNIITIYKSHKHPNSLYLNEIGRTFLVLYTPGKGDFLPVM